MRKSQGYRSRNGTHAGWVWLVNHGAGNPSPSDFRNQPMRTPKIIFRSTKDLSIHPAVAAVWQLGDDHPDFLRIVESVSERGIVEPLKITGTGKIADGRHRWRAAKKLGIKTVPCIKVSEDEVADIALSTLADRRHLVTKGQLAFSAYPLMEKAHAEILKRREETMRGHGAGESPITVEQLAEKLGIGRRLFFYAASLHDLFRKDADTRAEWEPKIMDSEEPIGLGAAVAGIAGQRASRGSKPGRNTALSRWDTAWANIRRPAQHWERWSEEDRSHAQETLHQTITALPDPVLDVVRDALRAARRARTENATKEQE